MWRMTPQNPPVIKTITSTEQFDYFKKQLSIYYFPSSFYQEKVDKRLRLIGGYTYLIAVLAVFTFPLIKKNTSSHREQFKRFNNGTRLSNNSN